MHHWRCDDRGNKDVDGNYIRFCTENAELTEEEYDYMREQIKNIFKELPLFNLGVAIIRIIDDDHDGTHTYTGYNITKFSKLLDLDQTIHELTLQYLEKNFGCSGQNLKSARNVVELPQSKY